MEKLEQLSRLSPDKEMSLYRAMQIYQRNQPKIFQIEFIS